MVRQSAAPGGVGSPGGWCPQSASECLKGWSSSRESTGGLVWETAASAASLAPCARGRQAAARLAASPCRGGRGAEGGREQLAAGVLGTVLSQKGRDGGLWPGWVGTAFGKMPPPPGTRKGGRSQ